MMGDQIDITKIIRILLDSHIELSRVMFKPRLGNWILVNFEGTSLNFSMRIFPLFLKFPLTFMNMDIISFEYPTTK